MAAEEENKNKKEETPEAITQIAVKGYKSISEKQTIKIRPLTILAGANSSGKSSIMQPLLLLKQTLEESYDPGPLLLHGPNVKFTSAEQIFTKNVKTKQAPFFEIGIKIGTDFSILISYELSANEPIKIREMNLLEGEEIRSTWRMDMTSDEIVKNTPFLQKLTEKIFQFPNHEFKPKFSFTVVRNRCFLDLNMKMIMPSEKESEFEVRAIPFLFDTFPFGPFPFGTLFKNPKSKKFLYAQFTQIIHLPGLRGNPERVYPVSAVGETFQGTFENYTASVISNWQAGKKKEKIGNVAADFEKLGLTWKVAAKSLNDTQVELQVGRLPHGAKGGAQDLVNIADVGFGVSQTLPVIAALHAARPGQLVYLEQPEIHLHPRAQFAMAEVLADAAKRGVQVVAETHSSLLLLGIQALAAEGKLAPDLVKLHWFSRGDDGATKVTSADLDEKGRFGNWPADFDNVELYAQNRYLDAVEPST